MLKCFGGELSRNDVTAKFLLYCTLRILSVVYFPRLPFAVLLHPASNAKILSYEHSYHHLPTNSYTIRHIKITGMNNV